MTHESAQDATSAPPTRTAATGPLTGVVNAWPADAARVLERQLQRELFNSSDTGFVSGARVCGEGGEDMPPPGLALVRAPLADKPIVAVEEPRRATIKAILTSVASTEHHEGGSELDVDVDVRIKVDTVDFLVERQDDRFALCYTQLFLPRGNLTWPVVRKWTPSTASWATVTQLADSVSHVHQH